MLSYIQSWLYVNDDDDDGVHKNRAQQNPGPGRNLPEHLHVSQLINAKLSLKSPNVVQNLQDYSCLTEAALKKQRLRKTRVNIRQTVWPCTNPLLNELKKVAPLIT